jgi:hypothetical protein
MSDQPARASSTKMSGEPKNLGHHSVAFTAKIYGHLTADHRIREAGRVSYPAPAKNGRAGRLKVAG